MSLTQTCRSEPQRGHPLQITANLLVKKVKRVGFGFRNFTNYRIRLLLHCGIRWETPATARIRGRAPRSAA